LQQHGIQPESGDVVVSGATGGVGCWAALLLARLGYTVVGSTGKPDQAEWLRELGVARVISRAELDDRSERPLLSGVWAGAVDTVGGNTLATIIRQTRQSGCVTACGVVGGSQLELTVYPFILRGVQLIGIDSSMVSRLRRRELWDRLAGAWKPQDLSSITTVVSKAQWSDQIDQILAGKIRGRVVLDLSN
jgi:putative YhdH/YhfP family quinone oxidoreductase